MEANACASATARGRVGAGKTEDDEWETNENMSMGESTVWAKLGSVEAAAAKAATAGAAARAMVVVFFLDESVYDNWYLAPPRH